MTNANDSGSENPISESTIRATRMYATRNERNRVLGILRVSRVGLPENVIAAIRDGATVASFQGDDGDMGGERNRSISRSPWAAVTAKFNAERSAKSETPSSAEGRREKTDRTAA